MNNYLVYIRSEEGILSPIICNSLADAEELILSLAEEKMYNNYCWYIYNDSEYKVNSYRLKKRFNTETIYGALLLKFSCFICFTPISTY